MNLLGFGQPQQQNNSIFGAQNASPSTSSLFGANNTGFGAAKPSSFGFAPAQPSTSLFGQSSAAQPQTGGMFGQNANTSGGLFGANNTGFGNTSMATGIGAQMGGQNGSATVQYQPTLSTDTLLKGGQSSTVNTKQHCLTFMKEYEQKSIEELRLEDYMANRKGPQAGTSSSGMFNAQPQQQTGMFGSPVQPTNSGGLFGQAVPAQSSTGLFGSTTNTMGNSSMALTVSSGYFNTKYLLPFRFWTTS